MNEWKVSALVSLVVNVLMVGLVVLALITSKNMIEEKNREISSLNSKIEELKMANAQDIPNSEDEELITKEEVEQKDSIEDNEKVQVSNAVSEVPTENKTVSPKKEPDLKKYQEEILNEYSEVYYAFEGGSVELLLEEYDNATVEEMYHDSYVQADQLLNKMYTILKNELPSEEFAQLQQEQRKWLNNLEQSNKDRLSMGGSGAGLDIAMNSLDMTRDRCGELIERYFGGTRGYFGY